MKRYQIENLLKMTIEEAFEKNQRLVHFVVNKYYSSYKDSYEEDLVQTGNIGLWEALNKIDVARVYNEKSITNWLVWGIRTKINEFINKMYGYAGTKRREQEYKLTSYNKTTTEDNCEMIDILSNENGIGCCVEDEDSIINNLDLQNAIEKLNDIQKKIIYFILKGYEQKEIANLLGISEYKVSRYKAAAFKTLKEELKEVC